MNIRRYFNFYVIPDLIRDLYKKNNALDSRQLRREASLRGNDKLSGFTLVELLLYIALVGFFVTGAVLFTWDVIYGRERSFQKEVMDQNLRSTMARIGYEIRQAKTVDDIQPSLLSLENNDGSLTKLELVGDTLQISPSGNGPYNLTSNLVTVTAFDVLDLSSSDQNSKNIRITISVSPKNNLPGQSSIETTASQSVEFNSQFNFARQLLIDLSGATFTGSNRLTNAKVRNTGTNSVVIDKLAVSWTNATPSQALTEVQIAGGTLEWSGFANSGTEINIVDYLLAGGGGQNVINHLQFNSNISNQTLFVRFILNDGSSTTGVIVLGTGGGSGTSCLTYCQSLSYTTGTCRRRASLCTSNGEINETGGNQFCTVSPDDTCCCKP